MSVKKVIQELVEQNQLLAAVADIRGRQIEHLEECLKRHGNNSGVSLGASDSLQWMHGMKSSTSDAKVD